MLYLTDSDVTRLVTMEETIASLREVFTQVGKGRAHLVPRTNIECGGVLSIMGAISNEWELAAVKSFYSSGGQMSFMLTLFSTRNPEPVAVMQAGKLGQMRTGAASGLATDLLSRRNAKVFGCIGTGYQARAQVDAVVAVRNIERIIVHGRDERRMHSFMEDIHSIHDIRVDGVRAVYPSFADADIVTCVTTSSTPVINAGSVKEDCHINAVGGYKPQMVEIDPETVCSCVTVVSDLKAQAMKESGELIAAVASGDLQWDEVTELSDLLAGTAIRRRNARSGRTLFKSLGVAAEDLAAARIAYEKATELGVGKNI
ncbi:MAG: ornithine cyclodeaminase family protein [Candidatus Thermoplasmatota archaeon]|nr:ornithine cyclodeaminase family protein [Candidatus Thermoplasmatota archaeon]MCL5254003.1 ornithine cyclodeaminase family protein [Candidatus Thermoplasmatota archaeon]